MVFLLKAKGEIKPSPAGMIQTKAIRRATCDIEAELDIWTAVQQTPRSEFYELIDCLDEEMVRLVSVFAKSVVGVTSPHFIVHLRD